MSAAMLRSFSLDELLDYADLTGTPLLPSAVAIIREKTGAKDSAYVSIICRLADSLRGHELLTEDLADAVNDFLPIECWYSPSYEEAKS